MLTRALLSALLAVALTACGGDDAEVKVPAPNPPGASGDVEVPAID
jgi:hypothetical protein